MGAARRPARAVARPAQRPWALRAWREAYIVALGSRNWEGLVEVGDASLRIGKTAGFRRDYEAKARESYLAALFRARR